MWGGWVDRYVGLDTCKFVWMCAHNHAFDYIWLWKKEKEVGNCMEFLEHDIICQMYLVILVTKLFCPKKWNLY